MNEIALKNAEAWAANSYFDAKSRKEIQELLDQNNDKELTDRFYKNLEFGTGGMRGIIGAGNNRMNQYNIMRATQALSDYINKTKTGDASAAISYDSRRFSFEYAKITASVFAANNIHSYIYKRLNPVCLLSFSVRHHQTNAGVMITASHNPPEYNGYKVYWDDGCQITAPHDKNIINNYNKIKDFSKILSMDFDQAQEDGFIHWVGEEVENIYLKLIYEKAINPKLCKQEGKKLKFIYTPIHGTGLKPCTNALNALGLTNYQVVKEQAEPDEDFPTVTSPNPENPEALALAVKLLEETNSDVAFGSDPDADRIGVAVKHIDKIYYLSGNQIGTLLLNYVCKNLTDNNQMPQNPYCVKTIVTTDLQADIAKKYGVKIYNTLTGFKWICGKMRDIETTDSSQNFIFGTEESFGYLNHDYVRDKDGVAPITLLAEMSLFYKLKNMTLIDGLDEIFNEFGFAYETLLNINYYGAEGSSKIKRIMDSFRSYKSDNICDEQIKNVSDYLKPEVTNLPSSNVLEFQFQSGMKLLMRPSGTEPKIKFYLLIRDNSSSLDESKKKAQLKADDFINFIKKECERI